MAHAAAHDMVFVARSCLEGEGVLVSCDGLSKTLTVAWF